MITKKILAGTIVGGIVYFLLGWLFYGNLLADFFHKNAGTATGVDRAMDQFQWWALILGNLISGLLLTYIFMKSNVSSFGSGLMTGGVLGLFMSASVDFIMYATTNVSTLPGLEADIATFTVMSAIAGAIVGAVMGMIGKPGARM